MIQVIKMLGEKQADLCSSRSCHGFTFRAPNCITRDVFQTSHSARSYATLYLPTRVSLSVGASD